MNNRSLCLFVILEFGVEKIKIANKILFGLLFEWILLLSAILELATTCLRVLAVNTMVVLTIVWKGVPENALSKTAVETALRTDIYNITYVSMIVGVSWLSVLTKMLLPGASGQQGFAVQLEHEVQTYLQ